MPRKSVHFEPEVLAEVVSEAKRQGRAISWLIQRAWKIARLRVRELCPPERAPEAEKTPKN